MVPNHLNKHTHKYLNIIHQTSQKYNINKSLILTIIQTKSSFNPYTINHSNTLKLIQIIQHTTKKNIFHSQKKSNTPNHNFLFNPTNNINTNTTYLTILNNIYLNKINNPTSQHYTIITTYNNNTNNILQIFSNNKIQTTNIINTITPNNIYQTLTTHHPSTKSHHYLYKINTTQKSYHHQ